MSRKRKHEAHANHERWLVSYADFITLMFAFFVVMFASSQADKGRAKQVSESVTKALQEGQVTAMVARVLGAGGPSKSKSRGNSASDGGLKPGEQGKLQDLEASLAYLAAELAPEIAAGKLQLRLDPRGLVISLTEAAFFPSGEDTINTSGLASIDKIAVAIKKLPNPVRLEGHTDSVPIHNSRFRSNWELSSARGIAMLEVLHGRCEVPYERMAVAGYADTSPTETNDTEAGRARNRRVDVVILNRAGNATEPAQPQPQAKAAPANAAAAKPAPQPVTPPPPAAKPAAAAAAPPSTKGKSGPQADAVAAAITRVPGIRTAPVQPAAATAAPQIALPAHRPSPAPKRAQ